MFPELTEVVGPLPDRHQKLVAVLEFAAAERFLVGQPGLVGRPCADRVALARGFIAKAIWNMPTTRDLIDRLEADPTLRRLCGWPRRSAIPSESTFSRAFAEFAASELPARVHEVLVSTTLETSLVGHVSRDSTAIEVREKPASKEDKKEKPKRRRGRPRKGEVVEKEEKRVDKQLRMDGAGDDRGSADAVRPGNETQCQGTRGVLERLQTAHRYSRWRHSARVPSDFGIAA